jgi:hypothetical protein
MATSRCTPPNPVLPHECAPREDAPRSPWCGYCLKKLPDFGPLTVSLGFTWGKADFHGPTLKERQEKQIAEAKEAGLDPSPVGARWV